MNGARFVSAVFTQSLRLTVSKQEAAPAPSPASPEESTVERAARRRTAPARLLSLTADPAAGFDVRRLERLLRGSAEPLFRDDR